MSLRTRILPLIALALAACGDDAASPGADATTSTGTATTTPDATGDATGDTTDPTPDVTPIPGVQQGTAAIGAPIVAADVTGTCADGSTTSGTTEADGTFALDVEDDALPCVLTLTGGTANGAANTTTLHSFATDAGIVNITPLTDLALAKAVNAAAGQSVAAWAAAPFDFEAVAEKLAASTEALRVSLIAVGYGMPATWPSGSLAPFTTPFAANPASDPFDALLEDLAAGIDEAGLSYADALASFVAGSPLPAAVVDPNDLPLTGDGAALSGGDGATGTLNGTTYTHTNGLSWGYLPQFGVDTGTFHVYASGPLGHDVLTGWRISGFKAEVGTYSCKAFDNDTTRVQLLVGNGAFYDTAPAGGACKIEILSISQSAVTGRFSAILMHPLTGAVVGTVTDGYFNKNVFDGGGEPLPDGEVGMSFEMDGQTWRYTSAASLAFESFAGMSSAPTDGPGFPLGIQLHTVPNAVGTYTCDTDPDSYRQLNFWFVWDFVYHHAGSRQSLGTGPAGSSCRVTVTKAGALSSGTYFGTFEGTFEGTFVSNDLTSTKVVTNGQFRYIGPVYEPPAFVTEAAGSYPMKVQHSSVPGFTNGADTTLTIGADGTITLGDEVFAAGEYNAEAFLEQYHREPGILVTVPVAGVSLKIGVPDSSNVRYVHLEKTEGGYQSMEAAIRPIEQAMVDALEDLVDGSPYTLRNISDVANGCPTFELVVNGPVDPMNPYVTYQGPGAAESWGDSTRLVTDGDDLILVLYYSKIYFRPNGTIELRQLGGSFQEYATWAEDPAAISAAGCP